MNQKKRQYLGVLLLVIIIITIMLPVTVFAGNRGDSDDEGISPMQAGVGIIALIVIGAVVFGKKGDGTIERIGEANDPKIEEKIAKACTSNDDR